MAAEKEKGGRLMKEARGPAKGGGRIGGDSGRSSQGGRRVGA